MIVETTQAALALLDRWRAMLLHLAGEPTPPLPVLLGRLHVIYDPRADAEADHPVNQDTAARKARRRAPV